MCRLAAVLDASNDGVFFWDAGNIVTGWSRGAERIYGYSDREAVGLPVNTFLPPDRLGESDDILKKVLRGERVDLLEKVRVTKHGERIDTLVTVFPTKDAAGQITGAVTIARDVTERKQAERAQQLLDAASRIAMDTLTSRSSVDALRSIADAACRLTDACYAALGIAHPDGDGLSDLITVGEVPQEEAAVHQSAGILGLLLNRAEPLRVSVAAQSPFAQLAAQASIGSFLGVPIRSNGAALGSLYLTNKAGGGAFTEADEAALQTLGTHAAVAIHLLQMQSRQRALVSGLITAQEEERRAMAYDLHDGLTQFVMAAHAHLEASRHINELGDTEAATREMDQGIRYLEEAVAESRRLVSGLRMLALDNLGLAGALEQLLSEEKARAGWKETEFLQNVAGRRFGKPLETGVYRVAQEALTNARKHAETSRVRVLLLLGTDERTGTPRLTLEVCDWGRGFLLNQKTGGYSRFGLPGMIERVDLLGGVCEQQSTPGLGTVIRAVFSIPDRSQDGGKAG